MDHKPSRWKQFLFSDREPQFNPYVVPRVDPIEEAVALRRQKWAEFQLLEPHLFILRSQTYLDGTDQWPEGVEDSFLTLLFLATGTIFIVIALTSILFESLWLMWFSWLFSILGCIKIVGPKYFKSLDLAEKGQITLGEIDHAIKLPISASFHQGQRYKLGFVFEIHNGMRVSGESIVFSTREIKTGDEVVVLYLDEKNFALL